MTQSVEVRARRSGFVPEVFFMAGRALRAVKRDPETLVPALLMPAFFYAINIGALQDIVEQGGDIDFKAFQLPVAIMFAVTGLSRAVSLVLDIQSGYFDRLSLTPIRRLALLLGLMAADIHSRGPDLDSGADHGFRGRSAVRERNTRSAAVPGHRRDRGASCTQASHTRSR